MVSIGVTIAIAVVCIVISVESDRVAIRELRYSPARNVADFIVAEGNCCPVCELILEDADGCGVGWMTSYPVRL